MTTSGYVLRHLRVATARAGTSLDGTRNASRASLQKFATVLTNDEEIVGECNFLRARLK